MVGEQTGSFESMPDGSLTFRLAVFRWANAPREERDGEWMQAEAVGGDAGVGRREVSC